MTEAPIHVLGQTKAEANERTGTVAEVVEVLESFEELFDDDFQADLPSLTKHLSTRPEDNLKMLTEIIFDRLTFLKGPEEPVQEEAPSEPEEEEEEDLSALLDQKSVDEMSDEEMSSINIEDGEAAEEVDDMEEIPEAESEGMSAFHKLERTVKQTACTRLFTDAANSDANNANTPNARLG